MVSNCELKVTVHVCDSASHVYSIMAAFYLPGQMFSSPKKKQFVQRFEPIRTKVQFCYHCKLYYFHVYNSEWCVCTMPEIPNTERLCPKGAPFSGFCI